MMNGFGSCDIRCSISAILKRSPGGKYIEQTWIGLCNVTLTATACKFVFKGIRLCGTLLLTTIDEPPEAPSPAWWIWLYRVQPLMFELSVGFKNVSWRHMMEGHRPLSNKSNSLKLAFKPRQFHCINSLVMVQWWLFMGLGKLRFRSLQRILPTVMCLRAWRDQLINRNGRLPTSRLRSK